jgi:ribonuclease R
LQQAVELRFLGVDANDQHRALFALVDGCGLKPPKADPKEVTAAAS